MTKAIAPFRGGHVAILGLGPSVRQFLELTKRNGGRRQFCDEVWGINALGDVFACDRVFHMDDVRVQEIRAAAAPESNIAHMLRWLRTYKGEVITSRKHKDYPCLREFPLQAVLNEFPNGYFNSTAAYAVAYAIFVGAKRISCFGMDFTYPDAHDAEKGRACVEFWLGHASARGIHITVPKTTTLLDAMEPPQAKLYGYDCVDVGVKRSKRGIRIKFTERDPSTYPTADEVEDRYDHAKHPNPAVETA